MLDSILGLPAHPLLVHLPVVLLPLASLGLIALVLKPVWRPRFAVALFGLLALGAFGAVGAVLTGDDLAAKVGLPAAHESLGKATTIASVALLVVGGGWLWSVRKETAGRGNLVGWVAVALAAAVTVLTVLTGHSGATAAWSDAGAEPVAQGQPTVAPSAEATTTDGAQTYSMADVQAHNTPAACWAAIDSQVYDLTDWIPQHPGGEARIEQLCGTDASSAFTAEHGNNREAQQTLARYLLGPLG